MAGGENKWDLLQEIYMTQDKGAVMSLLSFGAANWMSNSATVSLLYIAKGVRRMKEQQLSNC